MSISAKAAEVLQAQKDYDRLLKVNRDHKEREYDRARGEAECKLHADAK